LELLFFYLIVLIAMTLSEMYQGFSKALKFFKDSEL